MNIMIIAAHPDDEVLGMGGTIKKLSQKRCKIHLVVVSDGAAGVKNPEQKIKARKQACLKAGKVLGISSFDFLGLPDMRLHDLPQLDINLLLEEIIEKQKPSIVYTTPDSDFHQDHQRVLESTLVATRPAVSNVKQVLSYEIPGTVKKPFFPNIYENIENEFSYKIKAFKHYTTEIQEFPHPRSHESIENLAIQRGIEAGLKRAEAFHLIRNIVD